MSIKNIIVITVIVIVLLTVVFYITTSYNTPLENITNTAPKEYEFEKSQDISNDNSLETIEQELNDTEILEEDFSNL